MYEMTQMEQRVIALLNREPEIEKSYRKGLINRRALARYLVARGVADRSQFDAVLATVRRHDFGGALDDPSPMFRDVRVGLKDRIVILDLAKEKELLRHLERVIAHIDYDRGDTLKIVVGTSSLKLFLDEAREGALAPVLGRFKIRNRFDRVSEISMMFPDAASRTRNILSVITRELALSEVVIAELLTTSPELLLYIEDAHVPRAYETIRRLQEAAPLRGFRRAA